MTTTKATNEIERAKEVAERMNKMSAPELVAHAEQILRGAPFVWSGGKWMMR